RVSSLITSSAMSVSAQVSTGSPQESPKSRKARHEIGRQALLRFSEGRDASRPSLTRNTTARFGGVPSAGFESQFAGSTLHSGLAQADQLPVALALPGPGRPAS